MTPHEIRVTAYNAITSALIADHDAKTVGCTGDDDCKQVAELARLATIAVDALGDMLPTGEEWFTRMPGGELWPSPGHSEAAARTWSKTQGAALLRQWTHEPTEVTE